MGWLHENANFELFRLGDTSVTPMTLVVLLLTVILTFAAARFVRTMTLRVLSKRSGASPGSAYAVARIGQYLVFVAGVLLGLDNVGIDITALAALGAVLSVGIGFGLQNITQNFVSGVILLVERPVRRGDFVNIAGTDGQVIEIEMRATRVMTRDGVVVLVPNSKLISEEVQNYTADGPSRLRIGVGVAYGSDTQLVRECLEQVGREHELVLDDPAPAAFFRGFGDSSLDFELCAWVLDPQPRPRVASDLRFAIDAIFRERGVTIPFPQRDLHVKSGLEPLAKAG